MNYLIPGLKNNLNNIMNVTALCYLLFILNILLYIVIGVFVMVFTVSDSNHTICSILSEISDDIASWLVFMVGILIWPIVILAIAAIGLLAILVKGVELLLKYIRNKLHSNNDE